MNFKYERPLNFYYKCGLHSHALKDCLKGLENNNQVKVECMQYGAWLRGEMSRRGGKELGNFRVVGDFDSRHMTTKTRPERIVEKNHMPSKVTKVDQVHVLALPNLEDSNPTWEITKSDDSKHPTRELKENGKVKGLMGKLEEKKAPLVRHP